MIRESLRLMHAYENRQNQEVEKDKLNQAIEIGLADLRAGRKYPASEVYHHLKSKIEKIAKG